MSSRKLRTNAEDPPDWINLHLNSHGQLQTMLRELDTIPPPKANREQLIAIIKSKLIKRHQPFKAEAYIHLPEEPVYEDPDQFVQMYDKDVPIPDPSIFNDTDESDWVSRSPSPLPVLTKEELPEQPNKEVSHLFPHDSDDRIVIPLSRSPSPILSSNGYESRFKSPFTIPFILKCAFFSLILSYIILCFLPIIQYSINKLFSFTINDDLDDTNKAIDYVLSQTESCFSSIDSIKINTLSSLFPNISIKSLEKDYRVIIIEEQVYPLQVSSNFFCKLLKTCDEHQVLSGFILFIFISFIILITIMFNTL